MTEPLIVPVGEKIEPSQLSNDFRSQAAVQIFGQETPVQKKIRETLLSPQASNPNHWSVAQKIFFEAGVLLAQDPDVLKSLEVEGKRCDFVLPRYIPEVPDGKSFRPAELAAHTQLQLEIQKIFTRESHHLDFEHLDPNGDVIKELSYRVLKDIWNPIRAEHSRHVQINPAASEEFLVMADDHLIIYRGENIRKTGPEMQHAPKVAM